MAEQGRRDRQAPAPDPLKTYKDKRRFEATPEPAGEVAPGTGDSFVVQKHRARALHYDVRFEVDGVMADLSTIKVAMSDPWKTKQVVPIVQFGRRTRLPEISDVPTARELARNDPRAGRLMTVPGVGPLIATALIATSPGKAARIRRSSLIAPPPRKVLPGLFQYFRFQIHRVAALR